MLIFKKKLSTFENFWLNGAQKDSLKKRLKMAENSPGLLGLQIYLHKNELFDICGTQKVDWDSLELKIARRVLRLKRLTWAQRKNLNKNHGAPFFCFEK